jgi:hypothetical protein
VFHSSLQLEVCSTLLCNLKCVFHSSLHLGIKCLLCSSLHFFSRHVSLQSMVATVAPDAFSNVRRSSRKVMEMLEINYNRTVWQTAVQLHNVINPSFLKTRSTFSSCVMSTGRRAKRKQRTPSELAYKCKKKKAKNTTDVHRNIGKLIN